MVPQFALSVTQTTLTWRSQSKWLMGLVPGGRLRTPSGFRRPSSSERYGTMMEVRRASIDTIAKWMFRGMDRIRHKEAFDVSAQVPVAHDFSGFANLRQCLLVTYKRSGEPMPSPINFGMADGKIYVRAEVNMGKLKRIRNNPHVVLVPCSFRGKPRGPAVSATARLLPESEVAHADSILAGNWSFPMKIFERSVEAGFDLPILYVEFTPETPA